MFASIDDEIKNSVVASHFNVTAEDIGKEVFGTLKIKINQDDANAKKAVDIVLKAAQVMEDGPVVLKSEVVKDHLYISILSKVGDTTNGDISKIRDILIKQGTAA